MMWFKLYKKKSAFHLSEIKLDQSKAQSYFKTLLKELVLTLTTRNICSEIEPEPHWGADVISR